MRKKSTSINLPVVEYKLYKALFEEPMSKEMNDLASKSNEEMASLFTQKCYAITKPDNGVSFSKLRSVLDRTGVSQSDYLRSGLWVEILKKLWAKDKEEALNILVSVLDDKD